MRRVPGRAIGLSPWNGSPDACASRCLTVESSGPAGSSRGPTPSSAATSVASAVAGFVIDAQRNSWSRGPRSAITSPLRMTATATAPAPHPSTCASASTRRDTSRIDRRLISSGSPYEPVAGFSRAVVAGRHVHVAGTAPVMPDGAPPPEDAYEQARRCLTIIVDALAEAGARPEDVVRTRMYVTSAEHIEEVGRAHRETFGDTRPATTGLVVGLLDPRWLVEIEAEAVLP